MKNIIFLNANSAKLSSFLTEILYLKKKNRTNTGKGQYKHYQLVSLFWCFCFSVFRCFVFFLEWLAVQPQLVFLTNIWKLCICFCLPDGKPWRFCCKWFSGKKKDLMGVWQVWLLGMTCKGGNMNRAGLVNISVCQVSRPGQQKIFQELLIVWNYLIELTL